MPPDDVILIGEVDSMTGNEATFGISTYKGISLAIQQANDAGGIMGRKLRLISHDVQGRPDEGARAISRLVTQDHVVAVITGSTSSNAIAMAPIAQQYRVPLIATAATNPQLTGLGEYIFRVCFLDPFQGEIMGKFSVETLGLKKVAILRDIKSDYSIGLANVYSAFIMKSGGEVLIDQSYSGGDVDFRSQLTAVRSRKPEAIFIPGYYTDVSLIARQARELGITVPLLGGDGWDSPKLGEIGGSSLNGGYYSNFYSPETPSPEISKFVDDYKKKYKVTPDGSSAMGYEAARFVINGLKAALKADPSSTKPIAPSDLRAELANTKDMPSLNGKISIDDSRNAVKSAVILKIESGSSHYYTTVNP